MKTKVKKALRLTSDAFDDEIEELIAEVKVQLKTAGILESKIVDTDPMIARAIKLYCKANFGLDNPDSEKYQMSFNSLEAHLANSSDYNTSVEEGV